MLQVSVAMMAKKYVSQMTLITKEILEQGRADAGASISGEMLKNGNLDFVKIWNEARKADEGEIEKDPKSVKEQLKDAVGSVVGNAKGMTITMSLPCLYSPISSRLRGTQSLMYHQLYTAEPLSNPFHMCTFAHPPFSSCGLLHSLLPILLWLLVGEISTFPLYLPLHTLLHGQHCMYPFMSTLSGLL